MELSIQEEARQSTSSRSESTTDTDSYDSDLAEAVARSLAPDIADAGVGIPSSAKATPNVARGSEGRNIDMDDDVARAINLSLQGTSSSPQALSTGERIIDETDFPSLSSSSPEGASRGKGKGNGKGKRRA